MNTGRDIIAVMEDPNLFSGMFAADSWRNWKILLKAIFCLPMSLEEVEFFKSLSGGREPPSELISETYLLAGRRSGKSRITALLACWKSVFFDYSRHTAPGSQS